MATPAVIRLALGLAGAAAIVGCARATEATRPAAQVSTAELPTQGFRDEHREIHHHLRRVTLMVGALRQAPTADQRQTMQHVVQFFEKHIAPHAEWEEKVLYPLVDEKAQSGSRPFTASMRHEHRIVERWAAQLAEEADKTVPDSMAFARQADRLLGLVLAHFEAEEEVLLPVLDATMTREEFERRAGPRRKH